MNDDIVVVGNDLRSAASCDTMEFETTRDFSSSRCSLNRRQRLLPLEREQEQQGSNDQLEKCGKWLASIPRDDIEVLRHTPEFREFLAAFERLGHAHLRVIVNNNNNHTIDHCHHNNEWMETKEEQEEEPTGIYRFNSVETVHAKETRKRSSHEISHRNSPKKNSFGTNGSGIATSVVTPTMEESQDLGFDFASHHLPGRSYKTLPRKLIATSTGLMKGNNHFLRLTDDILLRILEFLRCKCMIQVAMTCSRFRQLVTKSAIQKTHEISKTRQLGNVMQLLLAKEQIYYIENGSKSCLDFRCSIPVPMLLPKRRVLVTNAGDPEYNGVYYCTDCNGNGFVFTKPRFSSFKDYEETTPLQQQRDAMIVDEANPQRQNNNNNIIGGLQRAGRLPFVNHHNDNNDEMDRFLIQQQRRQQPRQQQTTEPKFSDGESSRPGLPLRCIIAKAYSNHEVLWYMSKEVDKTTDATASSTTTSTSWNHRPRTYSYFAPLMLSGNAPLELCVYPSQTSALVHQNEAWGNLRGSTDGLHAPTLEVIVGDE